MKKNTICWIVVEPSTRNVISFLPNMLYGESIVAVIDVFATVNDWPRSTASFVLDGMYSTLIFAIVHSPGSIGAVNESSTYWRV